MAKEFYNYIFEQKKLDKVKQFCYDNIILSGCKPSAVDATLFYLKHYGGSAHMPQQNVCLKFNISTVCLRNNVKRVRESKHFEEIKVMLGNPNIDEGV